MQHSLLHSLPPFVRTYSSRRLNWNSLYSILYCMRHDDLTHRLDKCLLSSYSDVTGFRT